MTEPHSELPSPCFVLEVSKLRKNLALLQELERKAGINILVALKGFALWPVFPILKEYLRGASTSSLNEVRLCEEELDFPAHNYCVAYHPEEVHEIFARSSHLTFNSLREFERYASLSIGAKPSLGLRVNPLYSNISSPHSNPAAKASRLGLLPQEIPSPFPKNLEGLHVHSLNEAHALSLKHLIAALEEHYSDTLRKVKWVNLGGGHLLTDPSYQQEEFLKLVSDFKDTYSLELFLELGTAIGWKAGYLSCTVLDILPRKPYPIAILDISFPNHLSDPWTYKGSIAVRGASAPHPDKPSYSLAGVSCMADDSLGEYSFEKPLSIGDALIFDNIFPYALEKSSHFNGIRHPAIALYSEKKEFSLLKIYDFQDYKQHFS